MQFRSYISNTKEMMLASKKVADRISDDSRQITYLDRMGLTYSRIMIRHRTIKKDLNFSFCDNMVILDQDHLEKCAGLSWVRRHLKRNNEVGKIIFFRRAKRKLEARL